MMMLKRRNYLPFLALAILVIAGVGVFFAVKSYAGQSSEIRKPNTVDYNPPTKEEKQETEAFKEQQQKESNQTPITPTKANDGRQAVTPVISYAGQYDALFEASAFIPGIFEEGGTCTLTLTHSSTTITKTTPGTKDAKTTRCNVFSFPSRELKPTGTWAATVSYSSPTAVGTSSKTNVEIK